MENALVAAIVAESFMMYLLDQRLRANCDPEVHRDNLGHPLNYWSKPEFFTPTGKKIRLALMALLWVMLVNIVVLVIVTA